MKRFADLYHALDATTRTNEKVRAIEHYFREAPEEDAAWAVYFLSGRRARRLVRTGDLRMWAAELSNTPDWLFESCYSVVGDLAETVALLLPDSTADASGSLAHTVERQILALRGLDTDEQRERLQQTWSRMASRERFVFNKLITGGFRVGVSSGLLVRGLSAASGVPSDAIMHRLMGHWEPTAAFFRGLVHPETSDTDRSRPYPFCLAHAVESDVEGLGDRSAVLAEWKWDGIRAQVLLRDGQPFIWTRGGELVTDAYPEIREAARSLPDGTVLDGELLVWKDGPLPFDQMQRRVGRKRVGKILLREAPVILQAFDLLEDGGRDIRARPLADRRGRLETVVEAARHPRLRVSPTLDTRDWAETRRHWEASREHRVEGLMLKRLDAPYATGRPKGVWWKWKVAPYTIDAVLIYAQPGHGRRSGLYTDYTFAVRDGDDLVPFAKAYSGLTDAEIRKVDRFVRRNTLERFGPVRSVRPELVFEIAFEGIWTSKRHKSGIAVRFPRMARWRTDRRADSASTLDELKALLRVANADD